MLLILFKASDKYLFVVATFFSTLYPCVIRAPKEPNKYSAAKILIDLIWVVHHKVILE